MAEEQLRAHIVIEWEGEKTAHWDVHDFGDLQVHHQGHISFKCPHLLTIPKELQQLAPKYSNT